MGRGGWKGHPVVVLGQRELMPLGLHPLVSMVARPVKHARLVTALLKATALMRSKAQARLFPLHSLDFMMSMSTQMPLPRRPDKLLKKHDRDLAEVAWFLSCLLTPDSWNGAVERLPVCHGVWPRKRYMMPNAVHLCGLRVA